MYREVMFMKRTQIYLDATQHEFLESLAFLKSRKANKRVTMSELIRNAIDLLREQYQDTEDETNLIIQSDLLMNSIQKAKSQKEFLTHQEVFGHDQE